MKNITVFCGSSPGNDPRFLETAYQLGRYLALHHIGLVYGGAGIGLMGAVANGIMEHNGNAIGVIPAFLKGKEIAHEHLSELIVVESMHERKTKMNELSDGVVALPGGYGTLEELFEMLTWAQLYLHKKPIALLNINGFYNDLLSMIQKMVDKGMLHIKYMEMLIVHDDIAALINAMTIYEAPEEKWLKIPQ